MNQRCFCALAVLAGILAPLVAAAQSTERPRTSWGAPDLQGVWDFRTITPLERPDDLDRKDVLTDEEAAQLEQEAAERIQRLAAPSDVDRGVLPPGGGERGVGAYNNFWFDEGTRVVEDKRTSLIVEPADGKLPALSPGAVEQIGSATEDLPGQRPVRYRAGGIGTDGPEDRGLGERCLVGFNSGPPMMPSVYNNYMQLFQAEDYVVILNEMVHDARIIPLDNRPHLPTGVRQWMGDARGRWEGDTLVVETTNFTDKTSSFDPLYSISVGTGRSLTLIERFRRVDGDTLLYEYEVNDPTTFSHGFTVALPMQRSDEAIYEYACHEGNYGLRNILAGARAAEKTASANNNAR